MVDSIDRLYVAVLAARLRDPSSSRTAKLNSEGVQKMAKKLAEEAVEVGLDAVQDRPEAVISESADLIYNLAVLWAACGVTPGDVWAEMERRERAFGIAEKVGKRDLPSLATAQPLALPVASSIIASAARKL